MKLILVLFLTSCTILPRTRDEITARCTLGIMPVIQNYEDSPYVLYIDGAVITIKCMEILE